MTFSQGHILISKENENEIIIIIIMIFTWCHPSFVPWARFMILPFKSSKPKHNHPAKNPSRLHNLVNEERCVHSDHALLYYTLRTYSDFWVSTCLDWVLIEKMEKWKHREMLGKINFHINNKIRSKIDHYISVQF